MPELDFVNFRDLAEYSINPPKIDPSNVINFDKYNLIFAFHHDTKGSKLETTGSDPGSRNAHVLQDFNADLCSKRAHFESKTTPFLRSL